MRCTFQLLGVRSSSGCPGPRVRTLRRPRTAVQQARRASTSPRAGGSLTSGTVGRSGAGDVVDRALAGEQRAEDRGAAAVVGPSGPAQRPHRTRRPWSAPAPAWCRPARAARRPPGHGRRRQRRDHAQRGRRRRVARGDPGQGELRQPRAAGRAGCGRPARCASTSAGPSGASTSATGIRSETATSSVCGQPRPHVDVGDAGDAGHPGGDRAGVHGRQRRAVVTPAAARTSSSAIARTPVTRTS